MLRTLRAPPQLGSLRESLLLLALMMAEHIEHAKFRAQAQLQISEKDGVEAFEEYMKAAFPYLETQKKREQSQYVKLLADEVKKGAIVITPTMPQVMRSRVGEKINRRKEALKPDEERKLYDRLGRLR